MLKQLTFFLCLVISISLYADDASHKTAALKLLKAAQTESLLNGMADQMDGMFDSIAQRPGITDAQKKTIEAYKEKATKLMGQELSWDKLKDEYAQVYMETYSEDELNQLTEFYQSPLGKKLLEKTPELMRKSMEIPQHHMQVLGPKMQTLMMEMSKQLSIPAAAPPTSSP